MSCHDCIYIKEEEDTDESFFCSRYPQIIKVSPNSTKCGEYVRDINDLVRKCRERRWEAEREIRDLRKKHKAQVERLRAKYRKLAKKGK